MPPSPTPNEAFIEQFTAHMDLLRQDPVPKGVAVDSLVDLETIGMQLIAKESGAVSRVGEAIVNAVSQTLEADVQPPFSEEQRTVFLGKITTFKALSETTPKNPKQKRPRGRTKPTDTTAIPTDKSKP